VAPAGGVFGFAAVVGGLGLAVDVDGVGAGAGAGAEEPGAISVVDGYVHRVDPLLDTSCCSAMWNCLVCPRGHMIIGIFRLPSGEIAIEPGVNGSRIPSPFTGIFFPSMTIKSTDQTAMCPSGAEGSGSYDRR